MSEEIIRPTPLDLICFLPYACKQLQTSFIVKVTTRVAEEYVSAGDKSKKPVKREKSLTHYASPTQSPENVESTAVFRAEFQTNEVISVIAACDSAGHLVELHFQRTKIPRILLKLIALCLPYQPFLNKLSIRWCPIDGYSIYEVTKCLTQSNITEIHLNDCSVVQRNYQILLDYQTHLRYLSLDRCSLENSDCAAIAAKLEYPCPASRSLNLLSLASNFITDDGAIALGKMLRSNRQLRSLNLSGNQITDPGAIFIFNSLLQFPMTYDEIISKRLRTIDYIKLQKEVYTRCYNELTTSLSKQVEDRGAGTGKKKAPASKPASVPPTSRPSNVDCAAIKAEAMTLELIGANDEPFCDRDTVPKNEYLNSIGNMSLSYLNLSHNQLEHASAVKLLEVMRYQAGLTRKFQPGLIRVVIEGNPLPAACREFDALQDLSDTAGANRLGGRTKSEKFKGKLR